MNIKNSKRLLIVEFLEKYPGFSLEEMSNILEVRECTIKRIINRGYIIIPSKMNKKSKKH